MSSNNSDKISATAKEIHAFNKAARAFFPLPLIVSGDSLLRYVPEKQERSEDEYSGNWTMRLS